MKRREKASSAVDLSTLCRKVALTGADGKTYKPEVLKQMDSVYHGIFERNEKPQRTLTIPAVSL